MATDGEVMEQLGQLMRGLPLQYEARYLYLALREPVPRAHPCISSNHRDETCLESDPHPRWA